METTVSASQEHEPLGLAKVVPGDALKGFFLIMDAWNIAADDARILLGAPAERTYYAWRRGNVVRVPSDTLRRIGYIAGVYKALQILYSDPHLADDWIRRRNKAFGGQTPLERMRGGDVVDLAAVRSYLDAARAPWS
jgi:antitoxin Xre/MbcA/ParS-like protein